MAKEQPPFKVNDITELEITGLGSSGEGVGKAHGFTVFVKGALPGETVRVKLFQVKKSYASGTITDILKVSPQRVEPPCPFYKDCGGCQLQHLSYEGQLAVKRQQVKDALERIGHIESCEVLPVIGMVAPWHYRNKMQFPAAKTDGKIQIGCYAALTHNVIDIDDCIIQKQANNKIMQVVRRWMQQFNIAAYDESTGKGVVRHVMGRVGVKTGDVMAVIITACYDIPHAGELVTMLKSEVGGIKSIVQNINKKRTNVIMGSKNRVLYGKSTIKDKLGHLKFNISPLSFFQVNSEQTEKLYAAALNFAGLNGGETVIDCYCGTGTISLYLAQKAGKVYGIEIVEPAIKDANANAAANNITNAQFICGDAAVEMPSLLAQGVKPDVVLLDPPRAGCDKKVLAAIAEVRPKKVVYVSCNPASLARDMAFLTQNGYKAVKAQPVDMFPMTHHVETVVLLSHKKADGHINVKVEYGNKKGQVSTKEIAEKADKMKPKEKVTYPMIQEFIEEKYGFHVSSLNIAQIKTKCGIIERENYNKSKNEDAKQPNCTLEKENAIKDAFRHFQMI